MTNKEKGNIGKGFRLGTIIAVALLGRCNSAFAVTVTSVVAGSYSNCAVFNDGSLKCWGYGGTGTLGYGDSNTRGDAGGEMGSALPFVSLSSTAKVTGLVSGRLHNCALLSDGSVKCWGYNVSGQLGLGDVNNRGDVANEMGDTLLPVSLGSGRKAVQLAAGQNSNCALLDDHTVKCWGDNSSGQLGIGSNVSMGMAANQMGDVLPTVDFGTGRKATQIFGGGDFFCALLDDKGLKCWGGNEAGQLGQGDTNSRGGAPGQLGDALPEINLGTGRTAIGVYPGLNFVCAQLDTGDVKCWGGNDSGQLGQGDTLSRGISAGQMGDALGTVPLIPGLVPNQLNCGQSSCCAIFTVPGTLQCWGLNNSGQLGLGDTVSRGVLAGQMGNNLPLVDLGAFARVVSVTLGYDFACALLGDSSVRCWGYSAYGELGLGTQNNVGDRPGTMGSNLSAVILQ